MKTFFSGDVFFGYLWLTKWFLSVFFFLVVLVLVVFSVFLVVFRVMVLSVFFYLVFMVFVPGQRPVKRNLKTSAPPLGPGACLLEGMSSSSTSRCPWTLPGNSLREKALKNVQFPKALGGSPNRHKHQRVAAIRRAGTLKPNNSGKALA